MALSVMHELFVDLGLMMQSFLSLEILFLTLILPTLLCIIFGCNFTDIVNVSLRFFYYDLLGAYRVSFPNLLHQ